MNRGEMIKKGASALHHLHRSGCGYDCCYEDWSSNAEAVLDAILPVVTTVEELEALPRAAVIASDQDVWRKARWGPKNSPRWTRLSDGAFAFNDELLAEYNSLTVVWQS